MAAPPHGCSRGGLSVKERDMEIRNRAHRSMRRERLNQEDEAGGVDAGIGFGRGAVMVRSPRKGGGGLGR